MAATLAPGPASAAPGYVPDFSARADWVALLARLTDGFVRSIPPGGSPAAASLPGARVGDQVPSIEGFARMSVAWAAWLHERTNPVALVHEGRRHDVAAIVARGLADATNPSNAAWWGPIGDRDQRIVEAAEIATALWLGGERMQEALRAVDPAAPGRVLDWLGQVDGRDLWPDNWVLFPVLPALLRRAAGRAVDDRAIDAAIDWMDAHAAGDGWYRDGAGHALDLYTGWAIHWHLLWWATIDGDRRSARRDALIRRARTWLAGVAPLFAADGSFPLFGRSLGYRFALAAPFVQAAFLGVDPLEAGVARVLAGGVLRRAVALGAIDPETDWFRVGVAGHRPEVVEGYVSAGASAWAAHAFLALAMPATHPFWSAPPGSLPAGSGRSGFLASADAGILATWSGATGETRLHNARIGHPADIADHDYAATYGKLAYRSAFPFDVPVLPGAAAGSDGAIVAIDPDGGVVHRNESIEGSAGPGWIRSRYRLPATTVATVETIVLVVDELEVRASLVASRGPVRLREGAAAIGVRADGRAIGRGRLDPDGLVASDGERTVAIRALLGYDGTGWSEPVRERLNIVDDAAIHPYVEEREPRVGRRIVAAVSIAATRRLDASEPLASVSADIEPGEPGRLRVAWPGGAAAIAFRRAEPVTLSLQAFVFRGRRLRVVRVDDWGRSLAGESVVSIDGVATFDRPGIVRVARVDGSVEVTTSCGVAVDERWSGTALTTLATRRGAGPWVDEAELVEPGVVPDRLVRRLRRRFGTRLVDLRLSGPS